MDTDRSLRKRYLASIGKGLVPIEDLVEVNGITMSQEREVSRDRLPELGSYVYEVCGFLGRNGTYPTHVLVRWVRRDTEAWMVCQYQHFSLADSQKDQILTDRMGSLPLPWETVEVDIDLDNPTETALNLRSAVRQRYGL